MEDAVLAALLVVDDELHGDALPRGPAGIRPVPAVAHHVPGVVLVEIEHHLAFRVNFLASIADKIIGDFFIHHIANKTLRDMKAYVEAKANKVTA